VEKEGFGLVLVKSLGNQIDYRPPQPQSILSPLHQPKNDGLRHRAVELRRVHLGVDDL
jgi:hypothetical protein